MLAKELLDKLQLHGRTLFDGDRQALFFNWTCAGFTVCFTGSTLKGRFTAMGDKGPAFPGMPEPQPDYPFFGVVADGGELERRTECREDDAWFTLFEGAQGQHSLRVVKLSENARGKLGMLELETDGEFLPAPKNTKPVIEVVGDSITCAFGNESEGNSMEFKTSEENGWMSYAALAARELDCEWSLICESGIAASKPKQSFFMQAHAMDDIYAYTDELYDKKRGAELTPWDFAAHPADVVVINLGTNDATPIRFTQDPLGVDPMEEHFQAKFRGLIEQIRRLNGPKPWIVCSLGSMDYFLFDRIVAAVNEYKAATGDEKVSAFKYLPMNNMSEGTGGGGHPSLKSHLRMGKELAFRLRPILQK